jgi:hypothetical protein
LVSGVLEVLEDVAIEAVDSAHVVITTRTAPVVGDEGTLHLAGTSGTRSIRVRIVESQLQVVKDDVRHRVRLACLDDLPEPPHAESVAAKS